MSNDANKLKNRQEIRKYLVFAGMFLLFIGCMWWIFAPSKEDRQEETKKAGFNTELPDPRGAGIEGDKIAAYEQADMRRRQEEKMRTLEDFSSLADEKRQENPQAVAVEIVPDSEYKGGGTSYRGGGNRGNAFASSASAYNDINATLGSFYQEPEEDPEKEALKAEVEQLRQAAAMQQPAQMTYEEQVALLEKSYELAARYTPGNTGTESREDAESVSNGRKAKAVPMGQVSVPVVSSLPQPVSDSMLFARLGQDGNAGFHTAVGKAGNGHARNTIRACVHGDQTVISGQSVRLRLLEPVRVGKYTLPRNTLVTGEGRIQGERLGIGIVQLEHDGVIIPVELTVYDNDGQDGIFIPGSMEASAVKEVAANLGQNLGTSISITNQSAKDQLLSELGKGAIQGVSQYVSKKFREKKVHLKSGYTLMLYQKDNQ